jgi:hypothetical protein
MREKFSIIKPMKRNKEYILAMIEDILSALAMMCIPIYNDNFVVIFHFGEVVCCNGYVIKE